jgi:hypothetical protein
MAVKKKSSALAPQKPHITLDALQGEIRTRAQLIFNARVRDGKPGDEVSDWRQAEKEIKAKYGL